MTSQTNRAPRPHRTSRKHSQTRRQAVASTAPERQEPQRTENVEKMAAVYASAVYQREAEEAAGPWPQSWAENVAEEFHLSDRDRELLDPHIHVEYAAIGGASVVEPVTHTTADPRDYVGFM